MFDVDADPRALELALRDSAVLQPLIQRWPGQRLPGAWDWLRARRARGARPAGQRRRGAHARRTCRGDPRHAVRGRCSGRIERAVPNTGTSRRRTARTARHHACARGDERKYQNITTNEELEQKLNANDNIFVLDVREAAEFAFNHIPNAHSIPLGELDERFVELNKDVEIYVICRTGSRSDFAAQKLVEGIGKVFNVVPGMSEWIGKTIGLQKMHS